jgi:hypothetical protein
MMEETVVTTLVDIVSYFDQNIHQTLVSFGIMECSHQFLLLRALLHQLFFYFYFSFAFYILSQLRHQRIPFHSALHHKHY